VNQYREIIDYRSLALAGVVQCAELVRASATGLHVEQQERKAVIRAITTHSARDLAEIFPEPQALRSGITAAIATLSGENDRADILRYALQLIDLAGRLKRSPVVTERLAGGLERLGTDPQDLVLAGLYQETISTLGKRIQVTGNPAVLQQADVADSIRALLLAGVRFAWLWNQLGGRRWQLIIRRRAVLSDLNALLTSL
jgi:high frequency lysogenization protein